MFLLPTVSQPLGSADDAVVTLQALQFDRARTSLPALALRPTGGTIFLDLIMRHAISLI
jgi:hypothetical protein